jgi:hypothetical protein
LIRIWIVAVKAGTVTTTVPYPFPLARTLPYQYNYTMNILYLSVKKPKHDWLKNFRRLILPMKWPTRIVEGFIMKTENKAFKCIVQQFSDLAQCWW